MKTAILITLVAAVGCGGVVGREDGPAALADAATVPDVVTEDLGSDGAGLPISCGAEICRTGEQVCCTSMRGSKCGAPGSCSTALTCSGATSCPTGQVCCGSTMMASSCAATCDDALRFCDTDGDCVGGARCVKTMMGSRICRL